MTVLLAPETVAISASRPRVIVRIHARRITLDAIHA
jgi:hypothetical protein